MALLLVLSIIATARGNGKVWMSAVPQTDFLASNKVPPVQPMQQPQYTGQQYAQPQPGYPPQQTYTPSPAPAPEQIAGQQGASNA